MLDLGVEHGLIQKSGSFFSYDELRLGQGRNNSKRFLSENAEVASEIRVKICEALDFRPAAPAPAAVEDAAEQGEPKPKAAAKATDAATKAPAKAAATGKEPQRKAA